MTSQVRLVQIGAATGGANIQIGKTGALLTAQIAQPLQGVPAAANIQLGKFNNVSGTFYKDPSNPSGGTPGQPIQVGTSIAGRTLGYITGTGAPTVTAIQTSGYFSIWNSAIVQSGATAFQIQTPSTGVQAKPAGSQVNNHQRASQTIISDVVNHQRRVGTISDVVNHQRQVGTISDVVNHQRRVGIINDTYVNTTQADTYTGFSTHGYNSQAYFQFAGSNYGLPTNFDYVHIYDADYFRKIIDYRSSVHFNPYQNNHQRAAQNIISDQNNHQRASQTINSDQNNHQRASQNIILDQNNHQRQVGIINDTRTPQVAIPASGTLYNGYWVNTQPGAQAQAGSVTGSSILLNIGQMGTLTTQGGSIQSTGPATGQYQVTGTFNQNQIAGQATAVVQTQQGVVVWGGTPATAHN